MDRNVPRHREQLAPTKWGSWVNFTISLILFALAVVHTWAQLAIDADVRGCVDVHGLEYVVIVLAGMFLGVAAGPFTERWASRISAIVFPHFDETSRRRRVNALATLFILLGMGIDIFWIVPSFNVYIDMHRALLAEADVVLYAMGALSGAGWYLLLDRHAWLGYAITSAMALMVIGSVLTTHSWC